MSGRFHYSRRSDDWRRDPKTGALIPPIQKWQWTPSTTPAPQLSPVTPGHDAQGMSPEYTNTMQGENK